MYTFQDLLDHFSDRPEIQEQLIANTPEDRRYKLLSEYLDVVLGNAFDWADSPEGHDYWHKIDTQLFLDAPQAP